MNRIFFFLCFCALLAPLSSLHAQTSALDQGSLLLGGDASFTSTGSTESGLDDSDRTVRFLLNPTAQYFVAPGLAVGGDVVLRYSSSDNYSTTSYGVGPAATYFFGRGDRSYYPFLSGSVSAIHMNYDDRMARGGETLMTYRSSAGMLVMLNRSVGLTGELFYELQDGDQFESDTFGVSFGISAFVF